MLRYAQQTAYKIGGTSLVKSIKKLCTKLRYLHKRSVKSFDGPVSDDSFRVAPTFCISQVDLCGHFSAYSPGNKRATIKERVVVFCCSVTGAFDCRIIKDYSADGFLMSFSRFAFRFGSVMNCFLGQSTGVFHVLSGASSNSSHYRSQVTDKVG